MADDTSAEARQWQATKDGHFRGEMTLGPYFGHILQNTPRRLLHMLSYYKFAAKMIGRDRRVLEVGCSEGIGTVLLAEFAREVVALDFDADAIETARRTVGGPKLRFEVGDVMTADLGRFDAAVTLDVIEHIYRENEDAFVAAIARTLGERGICIIGTPNETSDVYASPHTRAGHVNLYSADRLRELGARHFHHVFMFSANDEMVHTGFAPMAHYLLALMVDPRSTAP